MRLNIGHISRGVKYFLFVSILGGRNFWPSAEAGGGEDAGRVPRACYASRAMTDPSSSRDTPSTRRVLIRRSTDTDGSPASIFATRDWLQPILSAT